MLGNIDIDTIKPNSPRVTVQGTATYSEERDYMGLDIGLDDGEEIDFSITERNEDGRKKAEVRLGLNETHYFEDYSDNFTETERAGVSCLERRPSAYIERALSDKNFQAREAEEYLL